MRVRLRQLLLWLGLACGVAAGPAALAQTAPAAAAAGANEAKQGVGLGFGQVVLFGKMGSLFSNHIGFNLNYDYESGPTWGLYVNLHINSHGDDLDPTDSLSLKGLLPNLKVNLFKTGTMTFSVFGGLGAYMVGETLAGRSASFTLFAMDAGAMAMVEVGHIRFGPSLSFITIATGTDNSNTTSTGTTTTTTSTSTTSSTAPLSIGGSNVELFFNVMYMF